MLTIQCSSTVSQKPHSPPKIHFLRRNLISARPQLQPQRNTSACPSLGLPKVLRSAWSSLTTSHRQRGPYSHTVLEKKPDQQTKILLFAREKPIGCGPRVAILEPLPPSPPHPPRSKPEGQTHSLWLSVTTQECSTTKHLRYCITLASGISQSGPT